MRKRNMTRAHSGELWERLNQLIKVESPITFEGIRRWCPDVRICELDDALSEMRAAKSISVARDWSGSQMIETYYYGNEAAGVTLALAV